MADNDTNYDPSEHTVEEVKEYLADADPQEKERVLAAEGDGKNRAGIAKVATEGEGEERTDESGRVLHPWEVDPADQV